MVQAIPGLLLPFLGTSLGAACVFFLRGALGRGISRALTGFAGSFVTLLLIHALTPASPILYGFLGLVSCFLIGYLSSFIYGYGR